MTLLVKLVIDKDGNAVDVFLPGDEPEPINVASQGCRVVEAALTWPEQPHD